MGAAGARTEPRVHVVVADDHPLYRDGIRRAIQARIELELVGVCADGDEALKAIHRTRPDVAVLDLRLRGQTGLQILEAVRASGCETEVLILSAHCESALVHEAFVAGAAGYLSKDADRKAVCDAVLAVAHGDPVFPGSIGSGLVREMRTHARSGQPRPTPREREILGLIARGLTAPEIARCLYVGQTTVKTHLHRLYDKLGVSDRAAAVAEGMRRGWLR